MQKKIIALAVAGLASTAAFAQSNVTVYGVADAYLASVGSSALNSTVLQSGGLSGSRIGFKGVEDLGGGNKALFTLEYALGIDSAGSAGATAGSSGVGQARQSFVGLTGNWGTVVAGRLQTLAYSHNAAFNPTFGTGVDTQSNSVTSIQGGTSYSSAGTLSIAGAERLDNTIAYISPEFSGLKLGLAATNGASDSTRTEVRGTSDQLRAQQASLSYTNGALALGGVYRKVQETGAGGNGDSSTAIGASYDFGMAKLFANTAQSRQVLDSGAGSTDPNRLVSFGVVAPVSSAGAVILSTATASNSAANKATTTAALYKHSLSKRTSVYGGVAQTAADAGVQAQLAGVQAGSAVSTTAESRVAVALVGMNHSF